MLFAILGLEELMIIPAIGFGLVTVFGMYFFGMMFYAVYAECEDKPMPLDDRYLIGKINTTLWLGIGILALICMIL